MGFKTKAARVKRTAVAVVLWLICATPLPAYASSICDLYDLYEVDYKDAYPDGIITTIRRYQEAQRYVKCYRGVIESDFDVSLYENQLKEYKAELEDTKNKLLGCYNASMYDICMLEDKYVDLQNKIKNVKLSMKIGTVSINSINSELVPTYDEYTEAVSKKAKLDSSNVIGDLDKIEPPIASSYMIDKHNNTSTTYLTTDGAPIKALFGGEVTEVTESSCVISNEYKITVYYRNMSAVDVKVGDVVAANDIIGSSHTYSTLQLKLDKTFVDLAKLFEKE